MIIEKNCKETVAIEKKRCLLFADVYAREMLSLKTDLPEDRIQVQNIFYSVCFPIQLRRFLDNRVVIVLRKWIIA